ncbi:GntR family transcriptional regulator [Streptomyces purpurascens]|uniref:GntR family transcriptional regulator n=1 Tax=Streptomyces purpurascens TaxID=1924 RepID=UPI0033D9FC58
MSTPAGTGAPARGPEPHDGRPHYRQLRSSLVSLQRATTQFTGQTRTGSDRDRETVWNTVEVWLPLAAQRLREAEHSPSQKAHWQAMIRAARRPDPTCLPGPDLVLLVSAARRLMRALMEAERPGPSVSAIADTVRRAITDGAHPPGSLLGARRIATQVGAPTVERVDLALQDLQREGLLNISPSKRVRVVGRAQRAERPEQIAEWLRYLIQSGVYPPYTVLPPLQPLARSLVSSTPDVTEALRLLAKQHILLIRRGHRALVLPDPPFPTAAPPDLDDLILALTRRATPDEQLTATDVLAACTQTHSWWASRTLPPPDKADVLIATLTAAVTRLVSRAAEHHCQDPEVRTILRRAAVTALKERPSDRWEQIWRTACLGTLVRDLYQLEPFVHAAAGARHLRRRHSPEHLCT